MAKEEIKRSPLFFKSKYIDKIGAFTYFFCGVLTYCVILIQNRKLIMQMKYTSTHERFIALISMLIVIMWVLSIPFLIFAVYVMTHDCI